MRKLLLSVLCLFIGSSVLAATNTTSSVSEKFTAPRHIAKGLNCVSCHSTRDYAKPIRQEQCLTCHQSYLKVAERTKDVKPNPHFNHFGDRDCSTCHKGHSSSTLTCNNCHKFDLKTP